MDKSGFAKVANISLLICLIGSQLWVLGGKSGRARGAQHRTCNGQLYLKTISNSFGWKECSRNGSVNQIVLW